MEGVDVLGGLEVSDEEAAFAVGWLNDAAVILRIDSLCHCSK